MIKNILSLKLSISNTKILNLRLICEDCERDTPILTSNGCKMQYCTKSEFDSGECSINNDIIKSQWLNDIILFDFNKTIRYGSFTINSKGDMIYECSVKNTAIRLFYWIKSDGSFHFKNENGEAIPTKIIILPDGDIFPKRFESQIIFVSDNNNGEYLISISLWEGSTEYYNFENMDFSFFLSMNFTKYDIHSQIGNLLEVTNGDTKEYLHTFIGEDKDDRDQVNFYLITQKYSFSSNSLSLTNGYAINGKLKKRLDTISRIVSNFQINSIFVFYYLNKIDNNYNFLIELYDNNFQYQNSLTIGIIEDNYYNYRYDGVFNKGIYIKNNIGAFMFFKSKTNLIPEFRIFEINNDYNFTEKFNFQLSFTEGFNLSTGAIFNDMIKINDNRFSFISSSNDREKLYIILFDFYDNDTKIKERI